MNALKNAWSEEYARKGIPSSFRKDPTQALVTFISWFKKNGWEVEGTAADIGCGQGRNSFYLASQGFRVMGIEWLEENARQVNAIAAASHLPIHVFAQDAAEAWPIEPCSLDIAIDVFCYKHIIDKKRQSQYRFELWKALKPGGIYFISLASVNDGFYGPFLETSTNAKEKLIVDPFSNISSFLYSLEDLVKEFSDSFDPLKIHEQPSRSPMYGKEYERMVLNGIFRKLSRH